MKIAITLGLAAALTLASAALASDDGPGHRGRGERADANSDGRVTLQESQAALKTRLMRLDADRDGRITKAEMEGARERFAARRGERRPSAAATPSPSWTQTAPASSRSRNSTPAARAWPNAAASAAKAAWPATAGPRATVSSASTPTATGRFRPPKWIAPPPSASSAWTPTATAH